MKNYIGIDLGTTNSAICSFDGTETRIWKSPEQNDVTPSAIYIDKRGNRYVGKRAYDTAPHNPDNAATLFKRLMGTSTPIKLKGANLRMTPEECSAEILRTLFGYLPEEIRNDPETGTVITVPAAFNQMQKDATLQAAQMAGIGKVALMQEPVAAVMSVMRAKQQDGIFLIYDLGGGTLDVAIADSVRGRVNLLAHNGIAMCGGRDFDRAILNNIVVPWLRDNFDLPDDFVTNKRYKTLYRLLAWAAERAKIELSAREEAIISLSESETRTEDESGEEIYLDIPITRDQYNALIRERIQESIVATRQALEQAGLSPQDIERIVFIGGPTNYKPLRDKVTFELGVPYGSTEINPMTAVAEGASIFAESIDWSTQDRGRKQTRVRRQNAQQPWAFVYQARTPNPRSKLMVQMTRECPNYEFQIDCLTTGWTSGRMPLRHGAGVALTLNNRGDNKFKITIYDDTGMPLDTGKEIVITYTSATIDAIPASHSIGVEVLEKMDGATTLDFLVRAGDPLPKKGKKVFKAAQSLKANRDSSINIKLWEGEIKHPVRDNRSIGVLKINGTDFDEGIIPVGADLICEYEILDSGNIMLNVSVPCIGATFDSSKNFYSRSEGQMNFANNDSQLRLEYQKTQKNFDSIDEVVSSHELDEVRSKMRRANRLSHSSETESRQEAMEILLECRRRLSKLREENQREIKTAEINNIVTSFRENCTNASTRLQREFESTLQSARQAIEHGSSDYDKHLRHLRQLSFKALWADPDFVLGFFNYLMRQDYDENQGEAQHFFDKGIEAINNQNYQQLRAVCIHLLSLQPNVGDDESMADITNILRGH